MDRSAEALNLAVALQSAGLVHLVVRRAAQDTVVIRDHTIVYKATLEVNGTSSSSQNLNAGVGAGVGVAKVGEHTSIVVNETVQDLEPNATYEVRFAAAYPGFRGLYGDCEFFLLVYVLIILAACHMPSVAFALEEAFLDSGAHRGGIQPAKPFSQPAPARVGFRRSSCHLQNIAIHPLRC